MQQFAPYLPLIVLILAATVAKAGLHKQMRNLTQPQMMSWSESFLQGRMMQFIGILGVIGIILFVSSGQAPFSYSVPLLCAALALLCTWMPYTIYSTRKKMIGLNLPAGFQRAVILDRVVQGLLLGFFVFHTYRGLGTS